MLECVEGAVTMASAGGSFLTEHNGNATTDWAVRPLQAGDKLAVRAGPAGSWTYLAFAGDLTAPQWLNHTATHSISNFGGGRLTTGDEVIVRNAVVREDREGVIIQPDFLSDPSAVRVVMGPQNHHFPPQTIDQFIGSDFVLTDDFDRMGVRLSGPALQLSDALSIPSEPITRGSLQVAGDGVATLLLADHQTTGGYPKIATVISTDLDQAAQLRARDNIRFTPITPKHAISLARQRAADMDLYLDQVSTPKGSLAQRLLLENLISGAVNAHETS